MIPKPPRALWPIACRLVVILVAVLIILSGCGSPSEPGVLSSLVTGLGIPGGDLIQWVVLTVVSLLTGRQAVGGGKSRSWRDVRVLTDRADQHRLAIQRLRIENEKLAARVDALAASVSPGVHVCTCSADGCESRPGGDAHH